MPDIRLAEMDLSPIVSSVSAGRMHAAPIAELIAAAQADSDPANMCMQMFYLFQALGQDEFALDMQGNALALRSIYRVAGTAAPAVRLLALMGPGNMMDNTPLEFIVENSDIRLDLMFLMPDQELPATIPDHDIAIVAISDPDKSRAALQRLEELLPRWPRPLLNSPRHVLRCARDTLYHLLADVPDLRIPATRRAERNALRPCRFPLTLRPVGAHAGKGFARIGSDAELDAYLEAHPDPDFFSAEFIDYQSEDGLYRKARIALIDGKPYVCHLAISDNWMVHYISSGMQASAQKRAEEAAMMENFEHDFAQRHRAAFDAIAARLGLDYVVLDCGETRDGSLLLFEADIGGWIHATDPVDVFPYKPAVMQKAFDAFRSMLTARMKAGTAAVPQREP